MSRPARAILPLVALLLVAAAQSGCFGGATPAAPATAPVSDEEALRFADRAARFYRTLQGVPLPALITYTDPALREYFASAAAFSDYYSALATAARQATLRDGQAESVRVREFRFEGPDQAVVDVVVIGKHERRLRFWDIALERRDVWRRIDGVWLIVPEKL